MKQQYTMKKILDNYFKANSWMVFAIIMVLYFIALTIEFKFIFTDDFYLDAFESKKSLESIRNIMANDRNQEWVNYPIVFLVVLFPTLMISFALNIGAVFNEYKIKFTDLFKIALKAQLIFAINYLIATVLKWQGLVERHYGNINNNYDFQSLAVLFKGKELPFWIMYPLQNVNITEIMHLLFLSYGFAFLTEKKYLQSLAFVVLFYVIALLVWIIFTVFLQTILYN